MEAGLTIISWLNLVPKSAGCAPKSNEWKLRGAFVRIHREGTKLWGKKCGFSGVSLQHYFLMKVSSLHAGEENSIKVHDYMVGDKIGSGMFAQIRVAFHHRSKNPFAVKIISKQKLQDCPKGKQIVFNETILGPLLDHPSIIEIVEIADSHSQFFQFMRFAEHGDLLRRLRKAPIELSVATRMIDQILSAVEYLHSFGICHRDIKLENILVSKHTGAKICDFGFATLTFNGMVHGNYGSFEYSAPEAIKQETFNGFQADMWSVGVLLYAIFARKLPYSHVNRDFDFSQVEVDYSPVPQQFHPLISQLLSINPDNRPSATECRGFAALHSSQTRRKPPLSALKMEDVPDDIRCLMMSRLCQVLAIPYSQLEARMNDPKMNREKVLYILLKKRYDKLNMTGLDIPFRRPIDHVSEPNREAFFNSTGNTHDPNIEHTEINADSCQVYKKLHSFLMKQKCCVSSPIVPTPFIIQHKDNKFIRISYRMNEFQPGVTVFQLQPDPQSEDFSTMIYNHLEECFKSPQPQVA